MHNISLLLLHSLIVIAFALGALRLGKEALTAWVVFQCIVANLFVLKQVHIFSLNVTCSDVYAIGCIFGLNLLQEFFSKSLARKATWICFFFMTFFAIVSQIHLLYTPSPSDESQAAYTALLSCSPRLLVASLITYLIAQQVDVHIFGHLKKRLSSAPLFIRNGISTSFSQILDTALFSVLGLYGIVESIWDIMIFSYVVKMFIFALLTPLSLLAHKVVPQYDAV